MTLTNMVWLPDRNMQDFIQKKGKRNRICKKKEGRSADQREIGQRAHSKRARWHVLHQLLNNYLVKIRLFKVAIAEFFNICWLLLSKVLLLFLKVRLMCSMLTYNPFSSSPFYIWVSLHLPIIRILPARGPMYFVFWCLYHFSPINHGSDQALPVFSLLLGNTISPVRACLVI